MGDQRKQREWPNRDREMGADLLCVRVGPVFVPIHALRLCGNPSMAQRPCPSYATDEPTQYRCDES
jgi:hypothetical protein